MSYHSEFRRLQKACGGFIDATSTLTKEENEFRFNTLALEIFHFQFSFNPAYQTFCRSRKVTPASVTFWEDIPALITSAWKEFELTVFPPEDRQTVFFSSGTTTQKRGRHFHTAESLALYEHSLLRWFEPHLIEGETQVSILFLAPPPDQAPNSSLVHMFDSVRKKFGTGKAVFAATTDHEGAWQLDFAKIEAFFHPDNELFPREPLEQKDASQMALGMNSTGERSPNSQVLILGTAFSFVHLCDYLAETHRLLRVPPGTKIMETGGYKGRSRALAKAELHQMISSQLGIPLSDIICEYGMSELSSQAYDTPSQNGKRIFRFPGWVRTRIVSPETGKVAKPGEAGLLQVFDLANLGSVMAVQTEDLARQVEDGFELLGRAAAAEVRGCSLMNL